MGRSATTSPFIRATMRPVSVNRPTIAKSISHFSKIRHASLSRPRRRTINMRSWLSDSMISPGVMPVSRCGTRSRSSATPMPPLPAISKDEEVNPAAPMSWMATMASVAMSSRQASRSSFPVKGSPTCTVGRFSWASSPNSAEAMVAP